MHHNQWQINFVAYKTILIKEILRFMRIWIQTILPPAITMGLYFIIFGELIGSQLADVKGMSYMDFIVPGIILMSVIANSYSNVVSSFFSTKYQRYVEELLISPVSNWVIIMGYVSGGIARGLVVGFVVTLVSMYFTELKVTHWLFSMLVVVLTAMLFSLAGFINAVYARSFDDISIIPTFVLTPLTYLGGVFYSVEMLPGFWQQLALINPILHMVNAFRFGLQGITDVGMFGAMTIIVLFIVALMAYSIYLMQKGVGIKH